MRNCSWAQRAVLAVLAAVGATHACAQPAGVLPFSATTPLNAQALQAADQAMTQAIAKGFLPGGVYWVEKRGGSNYHRAYGQRALVPEMQANDESSIYDAASLTKVLATAPLVHLLRESGVLDLDAPVARYLPDCALPDALTVRLLLNHHGGLAPSLPLQQPWSGRHMALKLACEQKPRTPPGQTFVYSDIDFILLGEVVARLGGQPLEALARERIFEPLAMRDTGFLPLKQHALTRIAPTEKLQAVLAADDSLGQVLRGVVHDPSARRMGGVAGHAGVFTTSADVARFARMMLRGGLADDGRRVLAESSIALMSSPASPPGSPNVRSLGWDMDTGFSSPRGQIYGKASYGHTGFTGNALWIDPASASFFVLLSNRVHPQPLVVLRELYGQLGTASARAVQVVQPVLPAR